MRATVARTVPQQIQVSQSCLRKDAAAPVAPVRRAPQPVLPGAPEVGVNRASAHAAEPSAAAPASASVFEAVFGFDDATLQLERLVEETHQALLRDGLIESDTAEVSGPAIPSLDAVDKALEELQRGLAEIDGVLSHPQPAASGQHAREV